MIPTGMGTTTVYLPNPPTAWFFNLRQGDKLRLSDSGRPYTIAGPIVNPGVAVTPGSSVSTPGSPAANPERMISFGNGYVVTPDPYQVSFEFLFLMNGVDDDGDGFIDEGFDGIDNDGDGIIDPGFNGIDDDNDGFIDDQKELYLHDNGPGGMPRYVYPGNPFGLPDGGGGMVTIGSNISGEFEQEKFITTRQGIVQLGYTVARRPVPSEGARALDLPAGTVIDLTTLNVNAPQTSERSKLPYDIYSHSVDVMISPNGQVAQLSASTNAGPPINLPFYHFWITDREDVYSPSVPQGYAFQLPMLKGSGSDPAGGGSLTYPASYPVLRGERRLLSLNTRTGAITSTLVETMYVDNIEYPYEAAERGKRDDLP